MSLGGSKSFEEDNISVFEFKPFTFENIRAACKLCILLFFCLCVIVFLFCIVFKLQPHVSFAIVLSKFCIFCCFVYYVLM